MNSRPDHARHAFESLTPDVVLDALASVGLYGDGRLTALSSYENRVYQVHLEHGLDRDADAPSSVVVKFYRPERWTDAQIREEHDFSFELMSGRNPRRRPLGVEWRKLAPLRRFCLQRQPAARWTTP